MLSFSADLSIRHQNFAFCLRNLLLLPSSSMEILRESMESMDEFYSLSKPDTFLFKAKNRAKPKSNRVENEGSHKTETTREEKGHHGLAVLATTIHGGHHGSIVVATGPSAPLRSSYVAFCPST